MLLFGSSSDGQVKPCEMLGPSIKLVQEFLKASHVHTNRPAGKNLQCHVRFLPLGWCQHGNNCYQEWKQKGLGLFFNSLIHSSSLFWISNDNKSLSMSTLSPHSPHTFLNKQRAIIQVGFSHFALTPTPCSGMFSLPGVMWLSGTEQGHVGWREWKVE